MFVLWRIWLLLGDSYSNSHTSAPGHPDLHLYQTERLYHSGLLLRVLPQRSPENKTLYFLCLFLLLKSEKSCLICFLAVATLNPTVRPEFHNSSEVSGCVREMGLFSSRCHNCRFYTISTPILVVIRGSVTERGNGGEKLGEIWRLSFFF